MFCCVVQREYGHSAFAMTRARAGLLYNSLNFQYFVALMIVLGFVQGVSVSVSVSVSASVCGV